MAEIVQMPDGYGGYVGDRCVMVGKPGSHAAYARGSDLVVEWYDHGDDAPYESANLVIFGRPAQRQLMARLQARQDMTPHDFAWRLGRHFESYFAIKSFAEANGVPFTAEVDFCP